MNQAAAALGLDRGARVTDMRALVPDLRVEAAEEEADAKDLAALARWARRWCPWTVVDGVDGLLLDTTGSDHLWGGEAEMLAGMRTAFADLGLTARIAAAPTVGAAWALARHGTEPVTICAEGAVPPTLAPLPVAALRLGGDTVTLLTRLGLKTVGALADLPRDALIRRFRQANAPENNPVLRLDQATGRAGEPLDPGAHAPPLRALRRMVEPICEVESVSYVLDDLAHELCAGMEARFLGARRLVLTGYRADGGTSSVEVGMSRASRDPAHLTRLFRDRLERLEAGYGFDILTLEAPKSEELGAVQRHLTGAEEDAIGLAELVDRLAAKLGPGGVRRPAPQGSHIPERADALVSPEAPQAGVRVPPTAALPRPLRLLARPEAARALYTVPDGPPVQFVWRRQTHRVTRSEGPERIAPEWWREASTVRLRDYFRIEDSEGRRYWIFREGLPEDGRGGPPRWFVHGIDG